MLNCPQSALLFRPSACQTRSNSAILTDILRQLSLLLERLLDSEREHRFEGLSWRETHLATLREVRQARRHALDEALEVGVQLDVDLCDEDVPLDGIRR